MLACVPTRDLSGGLKTWKRVTGEAANPVFAAASAGKARQVEADWKRKATDEAKSSRHASKYVKTNDNSLRARSDYSHHDDGPGVQEVDSVLPQAYFQGQILDYYVTNNRIVEVERSTRGQGTATEVAGNLWLAERRKQITSSVTGNMAKCRSMTKVAPLVTLQHLSGEPRYKTWTSRSQPHGVYPLAKRECLPGISTQPSGLVIHPTHHWLAASPDDLVTDPALSDPLGIVDHYKFRNTTLVYRFSHTGQDLLSNMQRWLSQPEAHTCTLLPGAGSNALHPA